MTLTDPREALADQSDFIGYLVGLASVAQVIHTLAADGDRRTKHGRDADDFVYALLGLASLGAAIERFAGSATSSWPQQNPHSEAPPSATLTRRWLR